jgi:excisionase family DNA binding protein
MSQHLNHQRFKDESWMNVEEAQEFFRISRSTLYRWCQIKELPYTMIGGTRYFPKNFIENVMGLKISNKPKKLSKKKKKQPTPL